MSLNSRIHKKITSLFSLCVENLVKNLPIYDLETIKILPSHMKDRILRKLTTQPQYCGDLEFNRVLEAIVYPTLKTIDLRSIVIDDETLSILRECSNLREIHLTNSANNRITSEGLANLVANTPNLSVLDVTHCQAFNDNVLESLSILCPRITTIYANGCDITDCGLRKLAENNRTLTNFAISNTKITSRGISDLIQANCGNFRELRMDNCPNINDDIINIIAQNCPNLEIITFYNCPINAEALSLFEESNKHLKQLFWSVTW